MDGSGLTGFCKLFLYEHFVVRRLSWVFLVHDLNLSFAKELETRALPRLKVWAGLFRGCDLGALFRKRENLGASVDLFGFPLSTYAISQVLPFGELKRRIYSRYL